jgi:hypothetical protein
MNRLINISSGTTLTASATTALPPTRVGKPATLRTIGTICLVVTAGLVLAGCGGKDSKEPTPTQADANPVNPEDSASAQEKARIAQAVAMRQGIEPAAPTLKLRGGELATPEVLAAYNQELARLIFREKDVPESLEELARKKTMPRLPTPPPGKRIVYDGRNRIIRLDPP